MKSTKCENTPERFSDNDNNKIPWVQISSKNTDNINIIIIILYYYIYILYIYYYILYIYILYILLYYIIILILLYCIRSHWSFCWTRTIFLLVIQAIKSLFRFLVDIFILLLIFLLFALIYSLYNAFHYDHFFQSTSLNNSSRCRNWTLQPFYMAVFFN